MEGGRIEDNAKRRFVLEGAVQLAEPSVVECNVDDRVGVRVKREGRKALSCEDDRASEPAPFPALTPAWSPKVSEGDRSADALVEQDDSLLLESWQHVLGDLSKSKDPVKQCLTHWVLNTPLTAKLSEAVTRPLERFVRAHNTPMPSAFSACPQRRYGVSSEKRASWALRKPSDKYRFHCEEAKSISRTLLLPAESRLLPPWATRSDNQEGHPAPGGSLRHEALRSCSW